MHFSSAFPTVMHVDLNSCFATIEQQANPNLRGKPVAVAAYTTGSGCILTASYEAKRIGVKTGMQVREGRQICPGLIVLPPDPEKYRYINHKLRSLLGTYTPYLSVESIDEMVIDLAGSQTLDVDHPGIATPFGLAMTVRKMVILAKEIKQKIKTTIGEWLTVSIGISTNRYLAKVASGLHKPDGLDVITGDNIEEIFSELVLIDLCGIKMGNAGRLAVGGIRTTQELLAADALTLKRAFRSIVGLQWWARLHGYEDGTHSEGFHLRQGFGGQDGEPRQKTFGQSYALPKACFPDSPEFLQIVTQLVAKMGRRLRAAEYVAWGVSVSCVFRDHTYWHVGHKGEAELFTDNDFYLFIRRILVKCPQKSVKLVALASFDLLKIRQLSLLDKEKEKIHLTQALDQIHNRYGELVVYPARLLGMEQRVLDRIAFGKTGTGSE